MGEPIAPFLVESRRRQPPSMRWIIASLERYGVEFNLTELKRLIAFGDARLVVDVVEALNSERSEITFEAVTERVGRMLQRRSNVERRLG